MVRHKVAKRTFRMKYAASAEDESVRSTDGPRALGSNEPQKEVEKVAIPEGGEVHLQNPNILPDSLSITKVKTGEEFTESDDQTFGPGKFFFLAEEGTVFFDPTDAGTRVQIEYLWKEEADEEEEESDDEDPDTGSIEDDGEEKQTKTKSSPEDSLWHLDQEWYKWKPLSHKVSVNNSLQAKLEKGVDLRRGLKVRNEKSGKELRVVLSGLDKKGNSKRQPGPGEVVYNYSNGNLYWGDPAASGNTYVVEYFLKGQKGEPVTMAGEENEEKEYNLLESFKSRAENLWTHLLDNPSPEFVRDTLLPVIEDEIEHVREEALNQKSEARREQELKGIPDLTGEFMELEQLLAKREENDSDETRRTVRDFIESDISPKLSRFYALASLLAERAYDMQSASEKDEDFPEFGSGGARALDLPTLKYLKKVRQEANNLDGDLVDFSKYYTGLLVSWILDSDTYYPSANPSKKKGKDPRWEGIKRVFEQAGVGMADLQAVALEAFRRALLEFDRDKRDKQAIPDPKKFRVFGNPMIKRRVQYALKRLFDKYQREQTVESTSRSGTKSVTVPEDGKEFDLGVPGLRVEDLQIKNKAGDLFTSANGVLLPTEAEARKSNRVKIQIPGSKNKDAQVSVTVPETGEKLQIIRSTGNPWNTALKKKVAEDPTVFYYAHSSGLIWLSDKYRGKKLLVEAPDLSGDGGAIGKNQYRAHPTRGTIEFSPQNAGEEVEISYSQTIRSKRHVSPMIKTDEEGEEASLLDVKEDEGADPLSKAEEAVSQENVDKLLDAIADILTVDEDPRLSEEDRAILTGLLGIGEAGGQRLTIQEIATREPFNVDVSDSNKLNQIKAKRQKAANTLLEILREKAEEDPSLRKMVRPLESVLLGKDGGGGSVDADKFLSYLLKSEDKGRQFQDVLVGILGKSGLKQDEENILRWMWALPGKLRRDQDPEEKKYDELPNGTGPAQNRGARLQEIAIDEFGIEADDDGNISPAATSVVTKVYERALDKFTKRFNTVYEGRKDYFVQKYPDFVQYYDRQAGKENLRDELAHAEQTESTNPVPVSKPSAKKEPLFDQLKKSITGVDETMLRSLMEELVAANKKGGSLSDLVKQRQKDIDTLAGKGADLLEKKTKDIRAELDALKKAIGQTRAQLESIQDESKTALKERGVLRDQALSEADENTKSVIEAKTNEVRIMAEILAAINGGSVHDLLSPKNLKSIEDPKEREQYETFSYLRDADGDDLTDAKEDLVSEIEEKKNELRELRKKAVSLASADIRKSLRQLKQKIEDLKSRNDKFRTLLATQESEEESKRDALQKQIGPLQKKIEEHLREHNSAKELKALEKVQNYLSDHDELQRGDGKYSVENMFEVPKSVKGPGYQAPKLAPGEEDTYKPLPREDGPGAKVERKPTAIPEIAPPQPKNPTGKRPEAPSGGEDREERSKFNPPAKKAPGETQRSLFDELRAVAVPLDPDESQKANRTRVENFRILMNALRKHFAEGKSVRDFKPKLSASQTLPDQNKALRAVVEYLLNYGSDIKKGPGVWDFKGLFNPTIVKPVETLEKKPDLSTEEKAVESLVNAQPSLEGNKVAARVLHQTMERINKGEPLKKIIKTLGSSREVALRLVYFMSLHENLKKDDGKWDWTSLYTGGSKFPTLTEFSRSRPLESQMGPLVKGIQRQLQDEAGPGGGIESEANTEQRVSDMLHQMSELALQGMDLEQMSGHFEKEDKRGARPYSLTYLFQQVRNYLNRLNRTNGLANSRNDMGLSTLFGPGAPAGNPTEQDEIKTAPKAESLPQDDRTTAFRQMVQSSDMDEAEAAVAHRLVSSLQLRMEGGTKIAAELLQALLSSNPKFAPVVKKVLSYIGANKNKFESGVPGVPDLSALTGMPFKHPAAETSAPEAEKSAVDTVPSVKEILKEKVEPVSGEDKTKLRKSIFADFAAEHELDDDQKDLFADALRLLKEESISGSMADEGSIGAIDRLVSKTKGTKLEGVYELLIEFFHEKGLVSASGLPDFRGVVVPSLAGRDSYFAKDGSPNLKKVEEEDVSAEMPEPRTDVEEHAEDLAEEIGGERGRISPDLQDAVDFLKSDQVSPESTGPRDTAKERLKKNVWDMMVQEFDFDEEEQQNAAEILETIQKEGLQKVKSKLKGKGHAEVLLDDLVDYLKEQGLEEADIVDIKLPETKADEDSKDEIGLTIEELMDEKPKSKAPNRLAPTVRREINDAVVQQTLDAAQKAQSKGLVSHMFDVAEVVRGLEGKVPPEDAKNALLQAVDNGFIELRPEASGALSEEDAKYVPVAADGVPFLTGKIIRMPDSKAVPEPASPAGEKGEPGTRGRLPAELTDRATGPKVYSFIAKHVGLTSEETAALTKELPSLQGMTYRQAVGAFKSQKLSDASKGGLEKYLRGLTAYLRLIQKGKDPLNKPEVMPAVEPIREKGKWREDAPTEKQVRKLHEISDALKGLGQKVDVNLEPKTKGEASDAINDLNATLQQAQQAPKKPEAPAPTPVAKKPQAPAPAASPDRMERAKLQKLMEKALEWSTSREVTSAQAFKLFLQKAGRKDLIPMYEKIMPEVQKALDAIQGGELDFDLSGI